MSSSTLSNQFITREGEAGEAPAEPWRRKLGRSLALPLFFKRFGIAKMFTGVAPLSHWNPLAGSFHSAARLSVVVQRYAAKAILL